MSIFTKVLRAGEGKKLKALTSLVPDINAFEPEMEALTDDQLRHKTVEFRQQMARAEPDEIDDALNDILLEAFAVVREAVPAGHRPAPLRRPAHGRRRAALRLDRRDEDRRGQDPRLHPARLPQRRERQRRAPRHRQRLPGQARRRVDGPGPPLAGPHRRPGLPAYQDPPPKRQAYACDVTYGTNNEFGFDYLRDNMAMSREPRCSGATPSPSSTRSTRSSSTRPAPR